ncbi:MAG: hypothetical protein J3Q66DRAFT_423308 [Benniella sp.]|nr:MAG: hypothetical protein J3Q66DRAFT_423308 [Benniella sp.]
MLGVITMATADGMTSFLTSIESNVKRFPEEQLSIYQCIRAVTRRHGAFVESIVPEILNLKKMYLPIEENVEGMICSHAGDQQLGIHAYLFTTLSRFLHPVGGYQSLIFNAAISNTRTLSMLLKSNTTLICGTSIQIVSLNLRYGSMCRTSSAPHRVRVAHDSFFLKSRSPKHLPNVWPDDRAAYGRAEKFLAKVVETGKGAEKADDEKVKTIKKAAQDHASLTARLSGIEATFGMFYNYEDMETKALRSKLQNAIKDHVEAAKKS